MDGQLEHLEQNIECCAKAAPLPADVLDAFDKAWAMTQARPGPILALAALLPGTCNAWH